MGSSVVSHPGGHRKGPLLRLRRRPGRLALAIFRLPLALYARGWGWLLGDSFLLLVHAGRKTGRRYSAVVMVLSRDPRSHAVVICSAWGAESDWVRNLQARPPLQVQIGREVFTPDCRFLPPDECAAVVAGFRRRHPYRTRLMATILGWGDLGSDAVVRQFVSIRPCVCLWPRGEDHHIPGGEYHD